MWVVEHPYMIPKSPKAVLFESLPKVAQKDHRRESIAMLGFYDRGFIAMFTHDFSRFLSRYVYLLGPLRILGP